jgi:hypothetical protein
MGMNFHEDLRRQVQVHSSSDRQFGIVIAAALTIYGLWPLRHAGPVRIPAIAAAALIAVLALARPTLLHPLNLLWSRLGLLMGRIANPVITAVLFFLVFTPAGLLMRLFGKDPLKLRYAPDVDTYWIPRQPPGPSPESMSQQF